MREINFANVVEAVSFRFELLDEREKRCAHLFDEDESYESAENSTGRLHRQQELLGQIELSSECKMFHELLHCVVMSHLFCYIIHENEHLDRRGQNDIHNTTDAQTNRNSHEILRIRLRLITSLVQSSHNFEIQYKDSNRHRHEHCKPSLFDIIIFSFEFPFIFPPGS